MKDVNPVKKPAGSRAGGPRVPALALGHPYRRKGKYFSGHGSPMEHKPDLGVAWYDLADKEWYESRLHNDRPFNRQLAFPPAPLLPVTPAPVTPREEKELPFIDQLGNWHHANGHFAVDDPLAELKAAVKRGELEVIDRRTMTPRHRAPNRPKRTLDGAGKIITPVPVPPAPTAKNALRSESDRLGREMRGAFASARASGKFALEKAVVAGRLVVEAKAWLKANPPVLQSWPQWFDANVKGYCIRSARTYEICHLQTRADSKTCYQNIKECEKSWHKANPINRKKRTNFPTKKEVEAAPLPVKELAAQLRAAIAVGELIPTMLEDLPVIIAGIKQIGKEDHAAERGVWLEEALGVPEGFHDRSPKLLPQGMGSITRPFHIEQAIAAMEDPELILEVAENHFVARGVRTLLFALLRETQDHSSRESLAAVGMTLFRHEPGTKKAIQLSLDFTDNSQ